MRESKALLESLQVVADRLRPAAVWQGSGKPVDAAKDDYVFELLCFFHIAMAAQTRFRVAVRGKVELGKVPIARWPKKPGLKANFSYLDLRSREESTAEISYQLCPGIEIADRFGKARSPDANLLRGLAGPNPNHQDLHACWDAKFILNSAARVSDVAIADFAYTYGVLGSPTAPSAWTTAVELPVFRHSGVMTNGKESTEPSDALLSAGIQETANFPHAPLTRPTISLVEPTNPEVASSTVATKEVD